MDLVVPPGPGVPQGLTVPAGTPVNVKRPLASAVVVTLVPTTLMVLTGVARLLARPGVLAADPLADDT